MVQGNIKKQEERCIREIFIIIKNKERGFKYMNIINIIKEHGKMDIRTEKDFYSFQMEVIARAIFRIILYMDLLNINGMGRGNTLETGC